MQSIRSLNVAIELWGVAFCLIGIACSLILTSTRVRYRWLFVTMFSLELVSAGGDALAGIFRGRAGDLAWVATHAGNSITFMGGIVLVAALNTYLCLRIMEATNKDYASWMNAVWVLAFVLCVFVVLGAFFSIDENNLYHRSDRYWVPHAYVIAVSCIGTVLIAINRARLPRLTIGCLLVYTLAPIVSSIVQTFVYGLNSYCQYIKT